MIDSAKSLDEQYLDYRDKTELIFREYPEIEPLRYFIFRDLLIGRNGKTWFDFLKSSARSILKRPRTNGNVEKSKILIWIERLEESVVGSLIPVYNLLEKNGINTQVVTNRPSEFLPANTLSFLFSHGFIVPKWGDKSWKDFLNLYPQLHEQVFKTSFMISCTQLQGRYDELNRLLDIIDPEVILDASTGLMGGAALIITSKERSILTIELQHGITQAFYTPVIADKILTWGESSDTTLKHLGVPNNKIMTIGSPRHDKMRSKCKGDSRTVLLETLSLSDRPTIVFFSNGNDLGRNGKAPVECAMWLESVAIKFYEEINVVVRLHPKEDGSLYNHCKHLVITKSIPDLATTLNGCDWIGSLCSTVMYEALLYQKPVWQFYSSDWPELANNWREGLACRISSLNELYLEVDKFIGDGISKFDNELKDKVFANHGESTMRVVSYLRECIAD